MVAQANVRDLDEGLDNNNYEPLDILDEVEDGLMEVAARAAKVKPLCFVVGVSHIDNLYLATKINGHACDAMIDSGATHNFITPECVTKFGLKPMPLKDISISFVQGSTNVGFLALDIPMEAEAWKGKVNFLVVPMTGFDVILGLDWADKYLIAHFGRRIDKVLLDNLDGHNGVVVSLHRPTNKQVQSSKQSSPPLALCSAKVANRSLKKGGQLFLCTTIVHHQANTTLEGHKGNLVIQHLITEFNDVLTTRLPPGLPPKRAIDHKINILPGSTPPAKAPYKLNATQLAELKKQLIELETSGFIRLSYSLYGAPVIFVTKKDRTM